MSEWQPIETAPRDGREIIGVFFRLYGLPEDEKPTIYGPWTIRWADGRNPGWISSWDGYEVIEYMSDFGTTYRRLDPEVTHWQPLPDPPDDHEIGTSP